MDHGVTAGGVSLQTAASSAGRVPSAVIAYAENETSSVVDVSSPYDIVAPCVVTAGRDIDLFQQTFPLDVTIERPGQRAAESRQMSAAVPLGNVVRVGEHLLLKTIVPLHGDLDANAVFPIKLEVENRIERGLIVVQVFHKGLKPAFVEELFLDEELRVEMPEFPGRNETGLIAIANPFPGQATTFEGPIFKARTIGK